MSFALMPDQQAVRDAYTSGYAAVLAAPGAGKTTLISHLIAHWVESGRFRAPEILVLTFTESAAREFEQRSQALLPPLAPMPHFSTIHAFCNRLLRQLSSDFSERMVASEERRYSLVSTLLDRFDLNHSELDYARLLCDSLIPRYRLQPFAQQPQSVDDIETWTGVPSEHAPLLQALPRLLEAYETALGEENLIDYDMMISETLNLLAQRPQLLRGVRARYRCVIEDEAQDSNPLQAELLCQISGENGHLLRVGDPNQSIYAFSGADYRSLQAFAETHARFPMGQSNRSSSEIMHLANAFHRLHHEAFPSQVELQSGVANPPAGWLWVKAYGRVEDELSHLLQACRSLLEQEASVAILCRTNLSCQWLYQQLIQARLPATLHHDRADHFFQSRVIRLTRHVLDYLLRPDHFHLLQQVLLELGISRPVIKILLNPHQAVAEQLQALSQGLLFHPAVPIQEYQNLMQRAKALLILVERSHHPIADVLEWMTEYLMPDSEYRAQLRILQQLWAQTPGHAIQGIESFRSWLEQAGKRRIRQALIPEGGEDSWTRSGTVHLLTAHKAKGLEWDGVLMPLFQYGMPFSSRDHEIQVLLKALQTGAPYQAMVDSVETEAEHEAARLAYVGLTRARRFVSITASLEAQRAAGVYQTGLSPLFQSLQQLYREYKGGSTDV